MAADYGFVTTRPDARWGDQYASVTADLAAALRFQVPGTGMFDVSEIGFYGYSVGTSQLQLGIFTDDAGNVNPDTLVTNSGSGEIDPVPTSAQIIVHEYTGTKPQVTGGTYYWIVVQGHQDNIQLSRFATGGTAGYYAQVGLYPNWPSAAQWDTLTDSVNRYSLFAVIQSVSAGLSIPVAMHHYANL